MTDRAICKGENLYLRALNLNPADFVQACGSSSRRKMEDKEVDNVKQWSEKTRFWSNLLGTQSCQQCSTELTECTELYFVL